MNRSEIIDVFIVRASPPDRQELRRTLERMSLEELEQAHQALISNQELEAKKEQLLSIQAEAAANRALHQHYMKQRHDQAHKAQLKATESQDRETFTKACREYNISNIEANFSLIRHTLGPNFNLYQVGQAVTSGAVQAAGATQREQEQWRQEVIEAHNLALLTADLPTLRKLAREAGARIAAGPPPEAMDQVQTVRAAEKSQNNQFQPLLSDSRFKGEIIDLELVRQLDGDSLKQLIRIYGADAITARIREWS
jgi:hypothetical protein